LKSICIPSSVELLSERCLAFCRRLLIVNVTVLKRLHYSCARH
jgi:hypothetical protein